MNMVYKPVGGAIIGVTIPIAIEFGAKGARISDTIPYKWSGVVGTVLGLGEIGIAYWQHRKKEARTPGFLKEDEDIAMMAAMGGAKLATGVSILILDELRKRALYAFRGGRSLPLTEEEYERKETPVSELVEEI
jgi:hypothetical protein